MTLVGFKRMTVRILGEAQADEGTNLFVIEGAENKGATQKADIKGLAAESVKAYGSDIAYYVSRKGVGDVTADFEILDLPFAVRKALLGYKTEGELTYVGADSEPPYCSVLLESEDLAGNAVYLGFFKGAFALEDLSLETRGEKTTEPGADKLSFKALASDQETTAGQYVGYYIGKDQAAITKLKTQLSMVAAG